MPQVTLDCSAVEEMPFVMNSILYSSVFFFSPYVCLYSLRQKLDQVLSPFRGKIGETGREQTGSAAQQQEQLRHRDQETARRSGEEAAGLRAAQGATWKGTTGCSSECPWLTAKPWNRFCRELCVQPLVVWLWVCLERYISWLVCWWVLVLVFCLFCLVGFW